MKQLSSKDLVQISPIDGRYSNDTEILSKYYSEYAYIKHRVIIEIDYLIALSDIKVVRRFNSREQHLLINLKRNFNLNEAVKIKEIERKTNHDVKAIEYYIENKIKNTSLSDVSDFLHFGLTSEDINNIAIRIMLKEALENIINPDLEKFDTQLNEIVKNYKKLPMLARTHGQAAVPTTLGKEIAVFQNRLEEELSLLKETVFKSKLNGAIGNYNALSFAYPKTNWKNFSKDFVNKFNLEASTLTTQIPPYEDIITFFQNIQRVNGIILDLDQDMWRYISDGYFIQKLKKDEIGSSTMPQKINPINFENSEGNIIIANSLIEGFTNKLPLSRLQRDLSGSTISRNFGVCLAHTHLAIINSIKGLSALSVDEEKISQDLNSDWSILAEAVQIYLKKVGVPKGYELIKDLTRGKKLNKHDFEILILKLPITDNQKNELLKLTPENYTGIY